MDQNSNSSDDSSDSELSSEVTCQVSSSPEEEIDETNFENYLVNEVFADDLIDDNNKFTRGRLDLIQ